MSHSPVKEQEEQKSMNVTVATEPSPAINEAIIAEEAPVPIKTEEIKVPTGSLIDPSRKSDLMRERNIQITDDESGDDFMDITEII
jgi:hypothetical protein